MSRPSSSIPHQRWALQPLGVVVSLAALLSAAPAAALQGDLATKYVVNDADPVASIPTPEQRNADPLEFGNFLQDLVARAETAFRDKKFADAVKYYEALAQAVPDRAISYSRLCSSYAGLGKVDLAAANCGKALGLAGARVFDHARFINLTLQKSTLSPSDVSAVDASLGHLRSHAASRPQAAAAQASASTAPAPATPPAVPAPAGSPGSAERREQLKQAFLKRRAERMSEQLNDGDAKGPAQPAMHLPTEIEVLACRTGVRLREAPRLEQCVNALRELKADPKLLLPFEWSQALIEKDAERATALLERARKAGLPETALAAMTVEHDRALASVGPAGFLKRWGLVAAAGAALLALFGITLVARGRRRKLDVRDGRVNA